MLQACAHLTTLQQGMSMHGYMIRRVLESDVFVGNSLVAMYAKCGYIEIAWQLLNRMPRRNVVSWNVMIAGYTQNGLADEALELFHQMQCMKVTPDLVTIQTLLQTCTNLGDLQLGKQIHDYIIHNRLELDAFLGNSLVIMYTKCGSIESARQLFDNMTIRNVVSWNAMIVGYAENEAKKTLTLFYEMQLAGVIPNLVTMVIVLQACTHLGDFEEGKLIHNYVVQCGFEFDVTIENFLVTM